MLRLSTKGRYATRIIVALAMRDSQKPARKQELAEGEQISADYVEQILMRLKAGGLVRSHRGAKGGFTLAKDPREITVADVLATTEGVMNLAPCAGQECERSNICATREIWMKADHALNEVFQSALISDLAARAQELQSSNSIHYSI